MPVEATFDIVTLSQYYIRKYSFVKSLRSCLVTLYRNSLLLKFGFCFLCPMLTYKCILLLYSSSLVGTTEMPICLEVDDALQLVMSM